MRSDGGDAATHAGQSAVSNRVEITVVVVLLIAALGSAASILLLSI